MNNLQKVQNVFNKVFCVAPEMLTEDFTSSKVPQWDSVTQMALIGQLEDTFRIMFDIDDIYELSSYPKCLEILGKYGVDLQA